jgi:hypothetical protein
MIAYNRASLKNEEIDHKVTHVYKLGYISSEEKAGNEKAYPVDLYSPNSFICIGLFLLTIITVIFSVGLLFLAGEKNFGNDGAGIFIFFGIVSYAVLEFFVQKKKHFHSGVDAALMWASGGLLIGGLNVLYDIAPQANCLIVLALSTYFVLRFADNSMVLVATCALFFLVFFTFEKLGEVGRFLLPFISMVISALIYFGSKYYLRQRGFRTYRLNVVALSALALLIFYLSSNYFVVRELNRELSGPNASTAQPLPFGWFFWATTVLIPVIYISFGVSNKDRNLLRIGLLLVAASVFTVRYYHTIMPLEWMMLLSGCILLIGSYLLTRYLHVPRNGFISKQGDSEKDEMNVEGLIVAQTMGAAQPVQGGRFGGGSFGGGGASGEF